MNKDALKVIAGVVALVVTMVWLMLYLAASGLDPDSILCDYKIYKQPDGSYEVWSTCRTRQMLAKLWTYEDAKAYQVYQCKSLREFMSQSPKGSRVR